MARRPIKPTMLSKNPRCPHCGSGQLILCEDAMATLQWELQDDTLLAGVEIPGEIVGVHGHCQLCGHKWKLRGISQISQIPAYENHL